MSTGSLNGACIVFDLDGTLVDTAPDLTNALNHCLETAGYSKVPRDDIRSMIGHGARAMIGEAGRLYSNGFSEAVIDQLLPVFLDFYQNNIARESQPFPGCLDMLTRLGADGATLVVCTNKRQALADQLLSELSLADRFASIVGADSVSDRKPNAGHPLKAISNAGCDPRRAIMVGDSATDEKAALNAGLPFVYYPFGYGPIDNIPKAVRTVIGDYRDLTVKRVRSLLG